MMPKFLTAVTTAALILAPTTAHARLQPITMNAAASIYVEDSSIIRMGQDVRFVVISQPSDGSLRFVGEVMGSCRSRYYFVTPMLPDGTWGMSDQVSIAAPQTPIGKSMQFACNR